MADLASAILTAEHLERASSAEPLEGGLSGTASIGWVPNEEEFEPVTLVPCSPEVFPIPNAALKAPANMADYFLKRVWLTVQSCWSDFVYVHPMHSRPEDVLNAWATRMRLHPACVSLHCGDEMYHPPWTSVLTHHPTKPQLFLPLECRRFEKMADYPPQCYHHPLWVDISLDKSVYEMGDSDEVDTMEDAMLKIGVVSQDNSVVDFVIYPTTPMLWVKQLYRIIQYEKYGQEGTGFFHNRLEVKDTATCLELRMTSGSTISVVAVEVLEQARQLQLEKQVEMASQEAKVKPAQLPKRAAKKQEKAVRAEGLSEIEARAASKRADALMESLIREEEERQERQEQRKKKAEAKIKENQRKVDGERRERERLARESAEPLEPPPPSHATSSHEGGGADGEALGGAFVTVDPTGAWQEGMNDDEIARWRAAEEAAAARKSKERARRAAKKEKRLAAAKQGSAEYEPAAPRNSEGDENEAGPPGASWGNIPHHPADVSPATPPASSQVPAEQYPRPSPHSRIPAAPSRVEFSNHGSGPFLSSSYGALFRSGPRPHSERLHNPASRDQGRVRGSQGDDNVDLMACLGLSFPEEAGASQQATGHGRHGSGNSQPPRVPPGMNGGAGGYRTAQPQLAGAAVRSHMRPPPQNATRPASAGGFRGGIGGMTHLQQYPALQPPETAKQAPDLWMGGAAGGGRGPPPSHRPEERQSSNGFGALIDDHDEDYFSDLYCPLTLEVMTDPVVCADGISYERSAIDRWLQNHNTSPKTNLVLPNKLLLPNRALANLCRRLRATQQCRSE